MSEAPDAFTSFIRITTTEGVGVPDADRPRPGDVTDAGFAWGEQRTARHTCPE